MDISWSQIEPKEFEQICGLILEANNFSDIQWFGESGGDKGRDLIAWKTESPLSSIQRSRKWIIQCKRYLVKAPGKQELASFFTSAREHKPDYVLVMITNTLSSNTKDWLESVRTDYQFQIILWEERDLLREVRANKRLISEHFPHIYSKSDPIFFYHLKGNEIQFAGNEFDEISILVMNKNEANEDDLIEARKRVAEFIQFLKQNKMEFDWPTK